MQDLMLNILLSEHKEIVPDVHPLVFHHNTSKRVHNSKKMYNKRSIAAKKCIFLSKQPIESLNKLKRLQDDTVFYVGCSRDSMSMNANKALALGASFIPLPRDSNKEDIQSAFEALRRRILIKIQFAFQTNTLFNSKLHVPNPNWTPDDGPCEIEKYLSDVWKEIEMDLKRNSNKTLILPTGSFKYAKLVSELKAELDKKGMCVSKADKNLGLVVSNKSTYRDAVLKKLNDTSCFKQIPKNHAIAKRLRAFSMIKKLANTHLNKSSWECKRDLTFLLDARVENSKFPTPYVLWKMHKASKADLLSVKYAPPTRLIVPSFNAIIRNASVYFDCTIKDTYDMIVKDHVLKDTRELLNILEDYEANADDYIETYDVAALYPSIPIADALSAVKRLLLDGRVSETKTTLLLKLLDIVLKYNTVQFDGKFYIQIAGTTMGTSAAVIIANTFMYYLEKDLVNEFKNNGKLKLFKRFLDDILAIFKKEEYKKDFFKRINQLHPNIKLTRGDKLENGGSVFLDLIIYKGTRFSQRQRFDTKLYQKQFAKFAYIPFASFHPTHCKKSMISGEMIRAARSFSEKAEYIKYTEILYKRLELRGYNRKFFNKAIENISYEKRNSYLLTSLNNNENLRPVMVIPYTPLILKNKISIILRENWENTIGRSNAAVNAVFHPEHPPMIATTKTSTLYGSMSKTRPS